jgi:hypothetical protein
MREKYSLTREKNLVGNCVCDGNPAWERVSKGLQPLTAPFSPPGGPRKPKMVF